MLKIVKKPQPLSSLATISLRLQNGKKKLCPLYFFSFFGDVIIHKTGTMLTTGQGPIATPLGSENITDGNGVWDPGVSRGGGSGGAILK